MLALWVGGENTDVQTSDALMRTIFRTGIDEEAMLNMHSQGFVKSPSLLFPFEQDTALMHTPISEAKESIRSVTASIHRGVIPYYQPYKGGEISQVGNNVNPSYRENLLFLRRLHLQTAMKRVWKSYRQYAFGKDELAPLTRKGRISWGNNGALIIESMDTLWLMNLKDEFKEARDWVRDSFSFDNNVDVVSVSKTTSRILGGLISAFDLSSETILLEKAADLANRLYPAFSSSPSGIPFTLGNLNKPHYFNSVMNKVPLVEIESLQLEFRRLSKVLDKPIYAKAVKKIYDVTASISLQTDGKTFGNIPQNLVLDDSDKPSFEGNIKYFGSEGKLFFETLLKVSIQGGDINNKYRSIYEQGVNYMIEKLLRKNKATGLTFIADINDGEIVNKMDHSLCSYAGTLVLGAYTHPAGLNHEIAQRDLKIGEDLARTCYNMYSQMKSGLSPESVLFNMDNNVLNEAVSVPPNSSFYRLGSEFAESLFIIHQLTQNSIYQEWGWKIFESIENYCRTDVAYATLKDVNDPNKGFNNEMDSTFISKTLKYLYLLQDPYTEIDVLKHMFNGHGHPIKKIS